MKMRAALTILLLVPFGGSAQSDIADARTYALGAQVTVLGVVTNGAELGSIRYVQDNDAGIAVFPGTGSVPGFAPSAGQEISVTGILKDFNGLLEIDPVLSYQVLSSGNPLPAPLLVTPADLGEDVEAMRVRINGCQFGSTGVFGTGTWSFSSIGQIANVYVNGSNPLSGSTIPSGLVDVVGICSQYSTANPPFGGYQLLPRNAADLISSSAINLTSGLQQTDILPDGSTLGWSTNLPGSSQVRFGPTAAFGSTATTPGSSMGHAVVLSGLTAATTYHVQAFSVAGNDTAFSALHRISTASSVNGSIRAYFNQSVDNTVAINVNAVQLGAAIDDTIMACIDRATATIEMAAYNINNYDIVGALNDAVSRGVQVRYIAEGMNSNSALAILNSNAPVLYRTNSLGSGMHNKFIVVDADDPMRATVLTGSTNFTNGNLFTDANNLLIVQDQALARTYRTEFEEMWGGSGAQPVPANSRFGSDKTDNTAHLFLIDGTVVECYFSPSDQVTTKITHALDGADDNIELALFILTENNLRDALLAANGSGVWVRGIVDETSAPGSDFNTLVAAGIDLYDHSSISEQLHHKYGIVDHGMPASDPLVITGSHNWTSSANSVNDENTLILHSADMADLFFQEWTARRDQFTTIDEPTVHGRSSGILNNPFNDLLVPDGIERLSGSVTVRLFDGTGRIVREWAVQGGGQRWGTALVVGDLPNGCYVMEVAGSKTGWRSPVVRLTGH